MDKSNNAKFDVNVGTCDGVNLCELAGLYLLDLLTKEFGK